MNNEKIVAMAMDAFWGAIADAYPEVKSGDLCPGEVFAFTDAATEVVGSWLAGNCAIGTKVKTEDGCVIEHTEDGWVDGNMNFVSLSALAVAYTVLPTPTNENEGIKGPLGSP